MPVAGQHHQKNILIINPNYRQVTGDIVYRPRQPLSLLYIAAILEREFGYRVSFYDLNVAPLEWSHPVGYDDLIITSSPLDRWETAYYDYSPCLETIRRVKACHPGMRVVLTGAHGSLTPELLLTECPEIDVLIRGEPEQVIRELYQEQPLTEIRGLSWMTEGEFVHTGDQENPVDLDSLPLPAYHLIDFSHYAFNDRTLLPQPFSIVETSRGCPYHCLFCSKVMHGSRYRTRTPESVFAELRLLQERYGVRSVYFQDLEFTIDRNRVLALCELMIAGQLNMTWGCATRCDGVDQELLGKMKQAGCVLISFGVESLSDRVLAASRKGIRYRQIKEAKKMCEAAGIRFNAFTMTGLPGETKGTTLVSLIRSMLSGVRYGARGTQVRPYPGTPLWEMAVHEGRVDGTQNPWKEMKRIKGSVGNHNKYDQGIFIAVLAALQKIMNRKR